MAKKKIYAVRKGHKTGLFETWAECQKATTGYSGAEFRGFTDRKKRWHSCKCQPPQMCLGNKDKEAAGIVEVAGNMVIAYVDGSLKKHRKICIWLCDPDTGRRRIQKIRKRL